MAFNIGQMLANRASLLGKKEGFVAQSTRLTFAQMNDRANAVAHFLTQKGFKSGDKIAQQAAVLCREPFYQFKIASIHFKSFRLPGYIDVIA